MNNKYKTRICNYFNDYGKCNNGDECKFAHGENELRCLFDENCINENCRRIHINKENKNSEIDNMENDKKVKFNMNINESFILNDNDKQKINNRKNEISYSDILKKLNNSDDNKKENENMNIPIQFNINGTNIKDLNENIKEKENDIDIMKLINDMEDVFKKYDKDIKQFINDRIKDNYIKYIFLNNLNEIKMEIDLFKNNFRDMSTIINNTDKN